MSVIEARLQPGTQWPVASPVTLTVKFSGNVSLASWQWIDQDGKPPIWNGEPLPQRDLRPIEGVWAGIMPAPPTPGAYCVRLLARATGSSSIQTINLSVRGTAVSEEKLTRGISYVQDRNIWLLSMDLRRARAITHFGGASTASMPAWSSDGRTIAFIHDPGAVGSGPDLWSVNLDGTGARRVSAHTPGRSLVVCQA